MNFKTKHKVLEENVFADMVVMMGRYMEYKEKNRTWDEKKFIQYYNERNDTVIGRCIVQAYVIRQAKQYYENEKEYKDIRYVKVRRIFRRNMKMPFYSLNYEQFYFWKYVMDYIVENKDLFPIVIKVIIKECEYYTPEENQVAPYADCMQKILDWYYVCLKMGKGISNKRIANEMLQMFRQYSNFSEFKSNCRMNMKSIQ